MQHVMVGLYSWHAATHELWWDKGLADIIGVEGPGEESFDTCLRRVHPDDRASVVAMIAQAPEGERQPGGFRTLLDDGRMRHLLALATDVVRDQDGAVLSTRGVIVDVTSAREAELRLAAMLDAISDGFLVLDSEYRFVFVNRRTEAILGSTAGALVGRSIWDAFPSAIGTKFDEVYHRVMQNRVAERFEEFYPEPLNLWIEVRAEPAAEGIAVYFQDITGRRAIHDERERLLEAERRARQDAERAEKRLAYQATHDSLTGLGNRWHLNRLGQASIQEAGESVVVMFLDLDRFKLVNDSLGHPVGDGLLREVAERLSNQLRSGDILTRQGGDEFVAVLRDTSRAEAQAVADRMRRILAEPVVVNGHHLTATMSIGLAAWTTGATVETLLRDADIALYRAKEAGGNSVAWFDVESDQGLLDRIALESDLREAIACDELELQYQPSFTIDDGRLCGVETIPRWTHPERGSVPPEVFIPLAEDSVLIRQLGRHVLELACRQEPQWRHLPDFTVWVSVSAREITPGYARSVLDLLVQQEVPAHRIGIEVAESVVADEVVAVHELRLLHGAGVAVAIDDFGTGYSSLARLVALPISLLKIDSSFVSNLSTPFGRAVVDMIVRLADALGFETIAEGVETSEQLEALRQVGVDLATGRLLGRPAAAQASTPQILPA
jgi:diguanylate cyclase (GGDEF)-like protein/PAS domain S-box-containing protein